MNVGMHLTPYQLQQLGYQFVKPYFWVSQDGSHCLKVIADIIVHIYHF